MSNCFNNREECHQQDNKDKEDDIAEDLNADLHEEQSMFGNFRFPKNINKNKVKFNVDTEEDDFDHGSSEKKRSSLPSLKKTIRSRSQMLRDDQTSKILAPILSTWQGKPSLFDKVKSSVRKINDMKADQVKITSPKKTSEKHVHYWDSGNLVEDNSTFSGFK